MAVRISDQFDRSLIRSGRPMRARPMPRPTAHDGAFQVRGHDVGSRLATRPCTTPTPWIQPEGLRCVLPHGLPQRRESDVGHEPQRRSRVTALVNVPSNQFSGWTRVVPGDPAAQHADGAARWRTRPELEGTCRGACRSLCDERSMRSAAGSSLARRSSRHRARHLRDNTRHPSDWDAFRPPPC